MDMKSFHLTLNNDILVHVFHDNNSVQRNNMFRFDIKKCLNAKIGNLSESFYAGRKTMAFFKAFSATPDDNLTHREKKVCKWALISS